MGRAFEVRKAAMMKTGAAKAKLYSKFGKEIYMAAKNGGTSLDGNMELKRLVERAKKNQVPGDVIQRNIDKAVSNDADNYTFYRYEGFGPGGSQVIVDCLSDNVNRTVTEVRNCFTKTGGKLGVNGSVIHGFDHLAIVQVANVNEDDVLEALLNKDIEVDDVETSDDVVTIYGVPSELHAMTQVVRESFSEADIVVEEQRYLAQNAIQLGAADVPMFEKLLDMLEDCEDVQEVYHNVQLG
jgi:YebC/PmpR family DNA-binding regulatory protein